MLKHCVVKEFKLDERDPGVAVGDAIRDYTNQGYSVEVHYAGGMVGSVLLVCRMDANMVEGAEDVVVDGTTNIGNTMGTGNSANPAVSA